MEVAVLAVPRLYSFDVSVPVHVFGRYPGYRTTVCGDGPVAAAPSDPVADVHPAGTLDDAAAADIVVVPGYEDPDIAVPDGHLRALRQAHDRGARIVALCTGVFALAEAGLLKGRTVTTHWEFCDGLRSRFPDVDVRDNVLLVEDGPIVTSAGAGAGIDAALHVIQADFGAVAADGTAQRVVSGRRRHASEPQFRTGPPETRDDLSEALTWAAANLGEPITVQALAERSLLARRTFIRRFTAEMGLPPMRWVLLQRLVEARRLLETSDWPIERIARQTGFGTATNFRTLFRRELSTTPSEYRRMHRA